MKTLLVPIHPAGWPFIALFAAGTVALNLFSDALGIAGVVLTLWCVYFFRDPERITPVREGLIISPADGVVKMIDKAPPPKELNMGDKDRWRICVFMNVFNVHVNRIPISGTVTALNYRPGKFLNASLDKASELNERQSLGLTLDGGKDIAFVQIAGLVARRILCDVTEGKEMKTGERFGMIRFGSRVDVYLPDGVKPMVAVGQTAIAGETVIADIQAKEPVRAGETR
ncbi:MAG TPA: phosphatidylserine decarboxylase [Rhodospirillales bacterium]|nr:phosphatidylserine decarboxylase [Rhodospirillales bacterium]